MNHVNERDTALAGDYPWGVAPAPQVVADHDVGMHLVKYFLDYFSGRQREGVNGVPKGAVDKAASPTVEGPENVSNRVSRLAIEAGGARLQTPVVYPEAGLLQLLPERSDNALGSAVTSGRHHRGQLQDDRELLQLCFPGGR